MTKPAPSADRLPPYSESAEQAVLGCILLSPADCMAECIEKLKAGPEVFYEVRHQTIYGELLGMYEADAGIDLVTFQQQLKDTGRLDKVGGLSYLASLPDAVATAVGLDYYLDIILDKYLVRKLIYTCTAISGRAWEHAGDVNELLDAAERDMLQVANARATGAEVPMRQLVHGAIARMEEAVARGGQMMGVPTGFCDLDKMTTGLHEGEMIVIAARPSMGKTSLAMNIAEHVACDLKLPTGVFSLEMTKEQLTTRLISSRARVNLRDVTTGSLAKMDYPKLTSAAGVLAGSPMHIDDTAGLSILQLRARARRMKQQHGIKLFVIDYLGLLHSTSRKADNRQQEISDISGGIKALAKELAVPVIALCQLNRELEKRKGRPQLSDLRESGSIEQDADFVGLLWRPRKAGAEDEDDAPDTDFLPVDMEIAKQRNGPTGTVHFTFARSYTRFESTAKVSQDDVPKIYDKD